MASLPKRCLRVRSSMTENYKIPHTAVLVRSSGLGVWTAFFKMPQKTAQKMMG